MNDLNSIFVVGRIHNSPEIKGVEDIIELSFKLKNNHFSYNETKKEYSEDSTILPIVLYGKSAPKFYSILEKGVRIGVDGMIRGDKKGLFIKAYSLQILDPPISNKQMEEMKEVDNEE